MKAAISIPDPVFEEGERLARRLKTSRSQLYSTALKQFLAQHDDDAVTTAMNAVVERIGEEPDPFLREAARQVLRRETW